MSKTITVEVPEGIDGNKVYTWIAEGMSREFFRKMVMEKLKEGIDLDLDRALSEFEKTREDVWEEIKNRYLKKGLIK